MTDFKSEMREELIILQGENCQHTWKPINPKECDKCKKEVDTALSSLLALIEKRMPKEKVKKRKFLCRLDGGNGVQCNKTCDENCKDAEDWGLEYDLGDDYFNQCLSEIKKEMGI